MWTSEADGVQRSSFESQGSQQMREEVEASSSWRPALEMVVIEVEGWEFGWVAVSRPPCLQSESPPIYVTNVKVVHS